MTPIDRSPRGYAFITEGVVMPKPGDTVTFSTQYRHHNIIQDLWIRYSQLVSDTPPVDLTLELLAQLKSAFGDLKHWFWVQATSNRAVQGSSLDFLKDTLNFINTGKRDYTINAWDAMVCVDPVLTDLDIRYRMDEFKGLNIPDVDTALSNWITQPDGVRDVFMTAYILFCKK